MNSPTPEKTVPLYTRLPVDVAQRLEKSASDADRTVAAEMRRAIRLYLDAEAARES
jgi:hypothetical protein